MTMSQPCASWKCDNPASYEKPLCYADWLMYDGWELDECSRCHWLYEEHAFWWTWDGHFDRQSRFYGATLCNDCLGIILKELGNTRFPGKQPEERPVLAHGPLKRTSRYVYILKLADSSYYVGQTTSLKVRLQEHQDGLQRQTKAKGPRLVYCESFEGNRDKVNEREDELTKMNNTGGGRRQLRELIERFREPLRLLDLEA